MKKIAQLEARLEQLIEGGFARLFGRKLQAQDIALQLTRAMEGNLRLGDDPDPRPLAPDQYMIYTHPAVQRQIVDKHPGLSRILAAHLVALAVEAGYRLNDTPTIKILADSKLERGDLTIASAHSNIANSTAAMQRVNVIDSVQTPARPQLIIDKIRAIDLDAHIINVGRALDNQIILDDPHVSRHHIQLRLREGVYMLFDVDSAAGTYVNGVNIKEHRLKSGDVIRIGTTQMLYIEEEHDEE